MSARFSSWSRGAFLVAQLIGAGVSSSGAAESAPSDGFEKVRKELEATKTARTQAAQPAAGPSSSALPDWQGAAAVPPPTGNPVRKISERETKSANWLLEAMKQTESAPGGNGASEIRTRPGDDPRGASEKNFTRSVGGEKAAAGGDIRELKPFAGQPVAPDPFARFLGGWMTPQDYALLKPVAAGEAAPRDSSRETGSVVSSLNARTPELSAAIRASGAGEPGKKNAPSAAPRENPYLQALAPPAITSGSAPSQPSAVSPTRSGAASLSSQPAAATPPPPKAPDFPPVTDDEKYFKQLKRF